MPSTCPECKVPTFHRCGVCATSVAIKHAANVNADWNG